MRDRELVQAKRARESLTTRDILGKPTRNTPGTAGVEFTLLTTRLSRFILALLLLHVRGL